MVDHYDGPSTALSLPSSASPDASSPRSREVISSYQAVDGQPDFRPVFQ